MIPYKYKDETGNFYYWDITSTTCTGDTGYSDYGYGTSTYSQNTGYAIESPVYVPENIIRAVDFLKFNRNINKRVCTKLKVNYLPVVQTNRFNIRNSLH